MTAHSPEHFTPIADQKPAHAGNSGTLPKRAATPSLNEQQLAEVCDALAQACYRGHHLSVATLKSAGIPRELTERLSTEPHPGISGVLTLSDEDRKGLMHMAQETLRASGVLGFGGLIDFIEFARKFEALSPTAPESASRPKRAAPDLSGRVGDTIELTNALTERLIIALSAAQNTDSKQLCVVVLSSLRFATRENLSKLSNEINDGLSRVLSAGAETPVWSYGRKGR
jgi:hypothetical protein